MKRYLILIVGILVILAMAWASLGQPERAEAPRPERAGTERRQGMRREDQLKAIAAIEEQITKIKSGLESMPAGQQRRQDLPEEERNKLRENFRKIREERQQSIATIEEQLAKLKGGRQLRTEHEESIGKLNAIHELAVKEKATETAASIEKLIAEKKQNFEAMLQKLGLGQGPG
jgi:hypothetical protein